MHQRAQLSQVTSTNPPRPNDSIVQSTSRSGGRQLTNQRAVLTCANLNEEASPRGTRSGQAFSGQVGESSIWISIRNLSSSLWRCGPQFIELGSSVLDQRRSMVSDRLDLLMASEAVKRARASSICAVIRP